MFALRSLRLLVAVVASLAVAEKVETQLRAGFETQSLETPHAQPDTLRSWMSLIGWLRSACTLSLGQAANRREDNDC